MKTKLKKSIPYLVAAAAIGGLTTWYLKTKPKRQKDNREIDFQKVTV